MSEAGESRLWSRTGRARRFVLAPALVALAAATMLVVSPHNAQAAPGDGHNEYLSDHPDPEGIGDGLAAVVSGDGWHVPFTATEQLDQRDEVAGTVDVYVRDRARNTVLLISDLPEGFFSDLSEGIDPSQVVSDQPSISASGRYVVFRTTSPQMGEARDPDWQEGEFLADIYVCDRDPDGDGDFDEVLPDNTRDYVYVVASLKEVSLTGVRSVAGRAVISGDGSSVAYEHHADGADDNLGTV